MWKFILHLVGSMIVPGMAVALDGSPEAPPPVAGDREQLLADQCRLLQTIAEISPPKLEARIAALTKALTIEDELFSAPTHTRLWLVDALVKVHSTNRNWPIAEKLVAEAVAGQAKFVGERPGVGLNLGRFRIAFDTRRMALGDHHPAVMHTLVDLALAKEEEGHLVEAASDLEAAAKGFSGASLHTVAMTDVHYHLDRLRPVDSAGAMTKWLERFTHAAQEAERAEARGDLQASKEAWLEVVGGFQAYRSLSLSEADQLRVAEKLYSMLSHFLGFAMRAGIAEGDITSAYFGISNLKGGVFTHQYGIRLERLHPAIRPLLNAHDDTSRRLDVLFATKGETSSPHVLQRLTLRRTVLEAELVRRNSRLVGSMHPPPSSQLPVGSALIDYYAFDAAPIGGRSDWRLGCFVSRPFVTHRQKSVAYRDLGALPSVVELARRWNDDIRSGTGGLDPRVSSELRKRLWDPLQSLLDGANVIFVSPNSELAAIPFAALPGSKPKSFLIEDVSLVMVPTPRLLTPMKRQTEFLVRRGDLRQFAALIPAVPDDSPLLVGDVSFSSHPSMPDLADPLLNFRFRPLPGTAKEVQEIDALFRASFPDKHPRILTRSSATEAAVRQAAPHHRWIHLATHGYFDSRPRDESRVAVRSAVVLAGANLAKLTPDDDGLLTALEVGSLDLGQVEMAVLSACETGLGQMQQGEGVLGLQRAFQVAGVKTTVTSLWPVADEPTQVLMKQFYGNLWQKKLTRVEALREAQLWMLRSGKSDVSVQRGLQRVGAPQPANDGRLPPYYWAAFTLSGDWKGDGFGSK